MQEVALYSGVEITSGRTQPTSSYAIIRDGAEIAADMNTDVRPGDVIVARLALSP
ncbi:hypothetical protein PSQ19_05415 [Devosia algicola]|uniref:Uncharacterized protein n=1 Tax=Devosia algicola TaxID=3026418 RepID=A0ABY7YQC5_9HYPH|nr:hypothetical protein [Devosia algicola]WDR03531.1 hypothetical protein PSQ19_05415 [Devosia algicola]